MFKTSLKVELSHDHWVSCLGVLGDPGPSPWLSSLAFLSDEGSHWGILSWRGTWSNFIFLAKNKSVSVDRQWARAGECIRRKARMWGALTNAAEGLLCTWAVTCHWEPWADSFISQSRGFASVPAFRGSGIGVRVKNERCSMQSFYIWFFTKCMSSFPKILFSSQTFFRI